MKNAVRPDPTDAAQRVKEGVRDLARGALDAAGDLAADVAKEYRRSTRHFKMRAAIAGSWAVLSAVILWAVCAPSGANNPLGAKIELLLRNDPGVLMGTQILVENDSDRIWRDVTVMLDEGWRFEKKTVRPQDKLVILISQFKKDGSSAPAELEPRSVTIACSEGRAVTRIGSSR